MLICGALNSKLDSTLSEEVLVGWQSGDRPRDRGAEAAVRTACLCPTQTGLGPLQSSHPQVSTQSEVGGEVRKGGALGRGG